MGRRLLPLLLAACLALPSGARAGDGDGWTEPEVVAEHVPGGRIGIPLRGLVGPGGRTFVVWAEATARGERVLVAERDVKGVWTRTELASVDYAGDLEPKIVRADDGTIVVAWGGCLGLKGGGFSLRKPGAGSWTKAQPIHPQCTGKVDLAGGPKVVAAHVRAVRKTDLGKLFGNFIHDRIRQDYRKIAVAQLDGDAWTETAVLEKGNFLRCDDPCIAGEGVLYFRDPDKGPTELAWATLDGKAAPEVVSRSRAFRYGTDAAAAVWKGMPVVAIHDDLGMTLRRRTTEGWGDPTLLFHGWCHGIRLAIAEGKVYLASTTGPYGSSTIRFAVLKDGKDPSVDGTFPGWTCAPCLDGGRPVLFLSQQEKVTGLITADYRIVMVRRKE